MTAFGWGWAVAAGVGAVAGIILGHVFTIWSLRMSICPRCQEVQAFEFIRYRCMGPTCTEVTDEEEL